MDSEIITTEERELQEALTLVPEEVQDFMWGDAFEYILDVAQKIIPLIDTEREEMRRTAYNLLLRNASMLEESERLEKVNITPEKVIKILFVIDKEILTIAKDLIERYKEDVEDIPEELNIKNEPLVKNLSSIQERLSQTTIIAPTKRDYSIEKIPEATPVATPSPKTDPYREMPQE